MLVKLFHFIGAVASVSRVLPAFSVVFVLHSEWFFFARMWFKCIICVFVVETAFFLIFIVVKYLLAYLSLFLFVHVCADLAV